MLLIDRHIFRLSEDCCRATKDKLADFRYPHRIEEIEHTGGVVVPILARFLNAFTDRNVRGKVHHDIDVLILGKSVKQVIRVSEVALYGRRSLAELPGGRSQNLSKTMWGSFSSRRS